MLPPPPEASARSTLSPKVQTDVGRCNNPGWNSNVPVAHLLQGPHVSAGFATEAACPGKKMLDQLTDCGRHCDERVSQEKFGWHRFTTTLAVFKV